ncbi:DUF4185 domain-containing protein [Mycolicibacterium stellerae]|uniref:DUF4185 domain-containing protein n=1 Tax=Mycolicibacterium stellerae TaxID=2358193 RepID=UPI001F205B5A|nr:DUF4185 domain-containing protein [Mycolicibacterium stellerae]
MRNLGPVAATRDLKPTGGSWMVEVGNHAELGWAPIDGTYRAPQTSIPSQISGYEAADGNVYIAADSFDRSQGVTMYRVDADNVTDRSAWQPWTGNDWGTPGQAPVAVSDPGQTFGELSMREVGGQAVLSGSTAATGPAPSKFASPATPTLRDDAARVADAAERSDRAELRAAELRRIHPSRIDARQPPCLRQPVEHHDQRSLQHAGDHRQRDSAGVKQPAQPATFPTDANKDR